MEIDMTNKQKLKQEIALTRNVILSSGDIDRGHFMIIGMIELASSLDIITTEEWRQMKDEEKTFITTLRSVR